MPLPPSNVFDTGEQDDIVLKRNETWRRGFLVEEKDLDPESETYNEYLPVDLTGATIVGGVKKSYDDPSMLKSFTVYDRDDEAGVFFVSCDIGLAGGKLAECPWDVVAILASGRKIRCGAGVAKISSGVVGVTP